MTIRHAIAIVAFLSAAGAASAQDAIPSMPAVQADGVLYVADCQHRSRPTQAQVGEWTGQHNISQVYDTRTRLMADVARACRKPGVERVNLTMARRMDRRNTDQRLVAGVAPAAH